MNNTQLIKETQLQFNKAERMIEENLEPLLPYEDYKDVLRSIFKIDDTIFDVLYDEDTDEYIKDSSQYYLYDEEYNREEWKLALKSIKLICKSY